MNATMTRKTAPRASEQESLEAELVDHAEQLAADAARLRRRCAELNKELFSACGWTADLSRRLDRPGRGAGGLGEIPAGLVPAQTEATPTEDPPALDPRGVAMFASVTLAPWILVVCLLYVCWRLIA